jgi:two-component system response regulator ResD
MNFLLVDGGLDLESMLQNLVRTEFPDATLSVTKDGQEVLDLVDRLHPDVIILSVAPSNRQELSLCQTVRRLSEAVIVAVVLSNSVHDRIRAFDMGVGECVPYRFHPRELAARIKARLRFVPKNSTMQTPQGRMTVDGISIDMDQRELWVREQPVRLSPLEFDLLALLVANENRVLSRESLARSVWKSVTPPVNQVKTYVYRLRNKCLALGPTTGVSIENVRGVGYRLRRVSGT